MFRALSDIECRQVEEDSRGEAHQDQSSWKEDVCKQAERKLYQGSQLPKLDHTQQTDWGEK